MSGRSAATEPPVPSVDVFDPRVFARGIPHRDLKWLRDHEPVSWQAEPAVGDWPAGPGFWAVTRHAEVTAVLRDPVTFSSWLGATQIRDPDPADLDVIRSMMLNMDGAAHRRLRSIVAPTFSRRRLERFADDVAARARALLAAVASNGGCDLPAAVTDDFPLTNLAELLGVPAGDRSLLLAWTNRVIGYQDPEHGSVVRDAAGRPVNPRSPAMLADMFGYARDLAARKRAHPGEDLMTALVHAEVAGQRLTGPELDMFFFLVVIAGNDTVRSALPGGVLALVDHPDQYRRLRADGSLLPTAVEEMLRWHPPVLTFRRTASEDTVLAGRRIRRGDKVVVYHVSAHYDERAVVDPFRFSVSRVPCDHVAFGDGPHTCLGAQFARLQMRIFFREFLRVLPQVEPDGPPVRLTSNFINGLTHLPLRWTRAG